MPLNIRSDEVNRLAEKLASRAGVSKTEAVRLALVNELERREAATDDFLDKIRSIQDAFAAFPKSGVKADKAFYDSLYDE